MEKLKKKIKDYIFGKLLLILFSFSETHKLVRFQKKILQGCIEYDLIIRTSIDKDKEELEKHTSEYLKNISKKNAN